MGIYFERGLFRQPGVRLFAARRCRLRFGTIHEVFQFLAGFKERNFLGGHFHFRARFRIAAHSPAPFPRAKTAESADLNLLALLQGADDAIENGFDDGLRLLAGKFSDAQDFLDKVGLSVGCLVIVAMPRRAL
jgi:hypothetical protein